MCWRMDTGLEPPDAHGQDSRSKPRTVRMTCMDSPLRRVDPLRFALTLLALALALATPPGCTPSSPKGAQSWSGSKSTPRSGPTPWDALGGTLDRMTVLQSELASTETLLSDARLEPQVRADLERERGRLGAEIAEGDLQPRLHRATILRMEGLEHEGDPSATLEMLPQRGPQAIGEKRSLHGIPAQQKYRAGSGGREGARRGNEQGQQEDGETRNLHEPTISTPLKTASTTPTSAQQARNPRASVRSHFVNSQFERGKSFRWS